METFNSLGFNWGAVRFVPAGSIAQVSDKPVNYLFKEYNDPRVWLIQGGGRFEIPSGEALYAMGYNWEHVHRVPDGFAQLVPLVPRDGTLLKEMELNPVYVVYAGARFWIPNPDVFNSLGLDWGAIRVIPAGSISQVPEIPADYRRFAGLGGPEPFTVVDGKKFQLDPVMLTMLQDAGVPEYTLWPEALDAFPSLTLRLGDVSCNEAVEAVDALDILRGIAGLPNLGICAHLVGDADCDGDHDAVDALKILRWIAGLDVAAPAPEASSSPAAIEAPSPSAAASCAGIGSSMGVP